MAAVYTHINCDPQAFYNQKGRPQLMPKSKSDRKVLVVLSDTHAGHRVGLCNPDTVLYDEDQQGNLTPYNPSLNASQKYLWELYIENFRRTLEIAGRDPIVVIHNGDLTQGNKYPEQLISTRMSDHISIAVANLEMWVKVPNMAAMRVVAGTGSHEFKEGSATILVTDALKRAAPKKDVAALYHGLLTIGGVPVDYSHHGPHPGFRSWLKGNVARFYLRDLVMREIMHGNVPPRLVFRAHYHTYVRETIDAGGRDATLIITPSYCMIGDFGRQATQSAYTVENGHVVVEIKGGEVTRIHKLVSAVDIRTKETL